MATNRQLTPQELEEYRAERRAYKKQWRDKNKDKVNAYHREWRNNYKKLNGISYDQARYLANKERLQANDTDTHNAQ